MASWHGVSLSDFSGGVKFIQSRTQRPLCSLVVFVAQDGFVTIFKEMPGAAVAAVKVLGVPREKPSHDG